MADNYGGRITKTEYNYARADLLIRICMLMLNVFTFVQFKHRHILFILEALVRDTIV